jgi:hypothetical protein
MDEVVQESIRSTVQKGRSGHIKDIRSGRLVVGNTPDKREMHME